MRKPRYSIRAQLSEVEAELKMRRQVYPRQVTAGRMKQGEADYRIAVMEAVHDTLSFCADNRARIVAACRDQVEEVADV